MRQRSCSATSPRRPRSGSGSSPGGRRRPRWSTATRLGRAPGGPSAPHAGRPRSGGGRGCRRLPAVVVADRISEAGRDVLRRAGWGWLDRRGHLRLWASGVRIESPLPGSAGVAGSVRLHQPVDDGRARDRPGRALPTGRTGHRPAGGADHRPQRGGHPRAHRSVRRRGTGGTQDPSALAARAVLGDVGPLARRRLGGSAGAPRRGRRPGRSAHELLRVDERAATLGGAHITAAGRPAGALLRAVGRRGCGGRDRWPSAASRRVLGAMRAPLQWLPENHDHQPDDAHPWHVAHPLVCALRLAADPARGREMVDAWGIVPGGG